MIIFKAEGEEHYRHSERGHSKHIIQREEASWEDGGNKDIPKEACWSLLPKFQSFLLRLLPKPTSYDTPIVMLFGNAFFKVGNSWKVSIIAQVKVVF